MVLSLVLITGSLYGGIKTLVKRMENNKVLSHQIEVENDEDFGISGATQTLSPAIIVDVKVIENTPLPQVSNDSTPSDDWIYPGSNVREINTKTLILDTTDSHQSVTDWYKEKIKSTGGSVTSFVTTAVNNEIKNELEGAGGDVDVEVKIEKSAISDVVIINVNYKAN